MFFVFAGVDVLFEDNARAKRFLGVLAGSRVVPFFAGVGGALMLPLVVFMEAARTPRFRSAIIGIGASFRLGRRLMYRRPEGMSNVASLLG